MNKWVSSYLENGLSGLDNKPIQGRPSKLEPPQLEQLAEFIKRRNEKCQGGRLTGEDVVHYVYTEFGVQYHLHHVYKILKQLGFSWITSRSKHPKQSIQDQESFKNFQLETILHTPGHLSPERIDVWFQDEARFGQQNPTTRIWAETGTRPRVVKQQQFEYGYLFGAVCPATGQTEALVSPLSIKKQ